VVSFLQAEGDLGSWQYGGGCHKDDLGESSVSGSLQGSHMRTLLPGLRGLCLDHSTCFHAPAGQSVFPPASWRGLAVP